VPGWEGAMLSQELEAVLATEQIEIAVGPSMEVTGTA